MKTPFHLTAVSLALLATLPAVGAAQEQSLEDRLDAQEQRIRQLEQARYQDREANLPVRVSGFINAGAQSTNLGKDGPTYLGTDNEVRYTNFTLAGLQFDAELGDKVDATVQLLSEGEEDFDTHAEWAYVGYDFTPSLKGRAGRMVAPFYMHSQYYHVGYAYPWINLPAEVYQTAPLRHFDGVDLTWQFNTGDISHAFNVYHGSTSVESSFGGVDISYNLHNLVGANLSSTMGNLNTWLSYSSADLDVALPDLSPGPDFSPYSMMNEDGYFGSVGAQYEPGNLLLMAEYIELGIHEDWFPTNTAGYVTLGYRFGRWTPHLTWATTDHEGLDEVKGDPLATALYTDSQTHQKSWTFGLRGDVATNLAIKFEVSTYYDIGDPESTQAANNANAMAGFPLAQEPSGYFSAPIPDDEDNPMVFRAAVNLVF